MSNIKESLKANQEEILSSLPEEFNKTTKGTTTSDSSIDDKVETSAIKAELVANPSVDESAPSGELKDINAPK